MLHRTHVHRTRVLRRPAVQVLCPEAEDPLQLYAEQTARCVPDAAACSNIPVPSED